jgi:hypothetical protein
MIVGTHTAETTQDKVNIVLRAGPELDFSLKMKAQRMRNRQYRVLGGIEKIIFEVDRDSSIADLRSLGADVTGRCLYWPERCPLLARTMPEEDLIFTQPIQLPLPDVTDPHDIVKNPYLVDRFGKSHLKNIEDLEKPRAQKQRLEKIASAKSGRFLVFHPIAQISILMIQGTAMHFAAMGDHRMPISSLAGFDGKKMALLVDPYTGEAYFTGGRYSLPAPELKG